MNYSPEIKRDPIFVNKPIHLNSYISADIAEFIRQSAMEANVSFTFETVLSHTNKLFFMQKAKEAGYKVYLYFIATENPEINIDRVKIRVAQHGHQVKEETIRSRYYRSLQNLKEAVKLSDRSYIFDNSEINKLVAEITDGSQVEVFDENDTPNWFVKYLVD